MSTLEELSREAGSCVACALASTRTQVVFGSGSSRARLMLIGEAPGEEEDATGTPFVGRSGRLVVELLRAEFKLEREQCYIANVVKCRPPANRNPTAGEISCCAHFLEGQIARVRPQLVMTLGNIATRSLLGTTEGITALRGRLVERPEYLVLPTFHPAAALRSGRRVEELMRADFSLGAKILSGIGAR